jgi:high-affinity Fe2+/Pb2+ permease
MALTEEEQRLLEVLEASLSAEDPKLVDAMTPKQPQGSIAKWRWVVLLVGVVVGMLLLVAGIQIDWKLSVVGFLLMLAGAALFWTQSAPPRAANAKSKPATQGAKEKQKASGFTSRMEERWERRQGSN